MNHRDRWVREGRSPQNSLLALIDGELLEAYMFLRGALSAAG